MFGKRTVGMAAVLVFFGACADREPAKVAATADIASSVDAADTQQADITSTDTAVAQTDEPDDLADLIDPKTLDYQWTCQGTVAPTAAISMANPPTEDCSAGVWPDLDAKVHVCPTFADKTVFDPASGLTLPVADTRNLPTDIPVSESGSFLPKNLPATWPKKLRVVAWNMEYTDELDAQVDALLTHPELKDADVYLLSEVDRCSTRNDVRRAARYMAQKLQAEYVYGIEFVELSIGRTIGGDTGQAIVSRRPLTGAALTCHTQEFPWATDKGEPRIGQRVVLHADIPAGSTSVRVHAVHLESRDALGEKRAAQIKQVLDRAQELGCERPQIVAGDFNAWYPTAPELTLMKQTGFADALAAAGDTGETDTRGTRLDYMWVRGLTVSAGGVLRDVKLSDHFPLWADLTVL